MPFLTLGLLPTLAHAASTLGFTDPTPIQSEAIPAVLTGAGEDGLSASYRYLLMPVRLSG